MKGLLRPGQPFSSLGGLLASLLVGDGLQLRPSGPIGALIGAVIVLWIWGAIRKRARPV